MFVQVFKLGEEQDVLTVFPIGVHTIGRGSTLQCNDKRVSRSHATVSVTEDVVTITSIHINPCFLKVADSKTVTILCKDSTSVLNDGDTFAFLPDIYWFKVKLMKDKDLKREEANLQVEEPVSHKRPLENKEETPEKRQKMEVNEEEDEEKLAAILSTSFNIKMDKLTSEENSFSTSLAEEMVVTTENDEAVNIPNKAIDGSSTSVKQDDNTETNVKNDAEATTSSGEVLPKSEDGPTDQANAAAGVDDKPSTSNTGPKSRRERCWYGAECYRKNREHKQDFSHPGDSDFESDPEDDRPSCSFGARCYRKNKEHRREYKHPPGKPPTKKRARKKVNDSNTADYDDDDLSDMSEEDPFAGGSDSDEYVAKDSDAFDSDCEDSQIDDEDSENVKRLVMEAKKFVNK